MAALKIGLKARALRYLSMREHSRAELARKLARHAEASDDIEALLNFLEAQNWLSQTRFSKALVNRRATRYGNSRILSELQSHGIGGDALSEIKAELNTDEVARACAVWRKKFGTLATDAAERAKQMRFLQQRGFSHRAIQAAMRGTADDNDG
ncbi:MAG: recombination regulator RecX [Oxalobacteraceae bacterium]